MLMLLSLMAWAGEAYAQRAPGALGVGGQIGDPSGLTVKMYNPAGLSYDFLAAWDLSDDFFFLNVHGLYERQLGTTQGAHYFFGPGGYIGIDGGEDSEAILGISGSFGVSFLIEQFEFFGQLTPRLRLTPSTRGDLGGGLGVRYYL